MLWSGAQCLKLASTSGASVVVGPDGARPPCSFRTIFVVARLDGATPQQPVVGDSGQECFRYIFKWRGPEDSAYGTELMTGLGLVDCARRGKLQLSVFRGKRRAETADGQSVVGPEIGQRQLQDALTRQVDQLGEPSTPLASACARGSLTVLRSLRCLS